MVAFPHADPPGYSSSMAGSPTCFPGLIICFAIAVAIVVSHQPALGYIPSSPTFGSPSCLFHASPSPLALVPRLSRRLIPSC
ncbi:hypothetical protein V8C34DRAFT_290206 [Trichoderma compactum]